MSSFQLLASFAKVGAQLPGFVIAIGTKVAGDLADGKITPDEAESLAGSASSDAGDMVKVRVHGVDIVDDAAQEHLAKFVGRVTANLVAALR